MLPFSSEQFFAVFTQYNRAIWPAQAVAYILGLLAVLLLPGRSERSDRTIAVILALMWGWTGIGYHLLSFAAINKAAYGFSVLFIAQAAMLVYMGTWHRGIRFGFRGGAGAWIGIAFIIYAMVLYPLIGEATGHRYPELPMFGVTPCPVTIFTFGALLLTRRPPPTLLLVIPVLWSLIGGSAAFLLGIPQDWLLFASGILSAAFVLYRQKEYSGPIRLPEA